MGAVRLVAVRLVAVGPVQWNGHARVVGSDVGGGV